MLGLDKLKDHICVTETKVECPVKGCDEWVDRQRRRDYKRDERFKCPAHNIYISPTTFEYSDYRDNLLWKEPTDLCLLKRIKSVKRENRISWDNSEDAVSWNVFRFLEKNNMIHEFLRLINSLTFNSPEIIYWGYNQKEHIPKNYGWSRLNEARKEFGETIRRGSEPDIIIETNDSLCFIEAKLTSNNETKPSNKSVKINYLNGGDKWFSEVFRSSYETVAITEKKYELMRFWLLGTWMAKQQGLNFYLVNLVLSECEKDIELRFRWNIRENEKKKFFRITWEDIFRQILSRNSSGRDKDLVLDYFRNKTLGYDKNGNLRKAFSLPQF